MKEHGTVRIVPVGELEMEMLRVFDAPCQQVFDAYTKSELIQQWLLGPPGWTMVVCEVDLKVDGAYRYVWRNASGKEFGLGGIYREIVQPDKIVHTEKFEKTWYPGEAVVTTTMTEKSGRTIFRSTLRYESSVARDMVVKSNMHEGVSGSYNRLDDLLNAAKV